MCKLYIVHSYQFFDEFLFVFTRTYCDDYGGCGSVGDCGGYYGGAGVGIHLEKKKRKCDKPSSK